MSLTFGLLLLAASLLAQGFFSGSEIALVSANSSSAFRNASFSVTPRTQPTLLAATRSALFSRACRNSREAHSCACSPGTRDRGTCVLGTPSTSKVC